MALVAFIHSRMTGWRANREGEPGLGPKPPSMERLLNQV